MVTDVRPLPGGTWLAMCDCGLDEVGPDKDTATDWLLVHECVPVEPYPDVVIVLP